MDTALTRERAYHESAPFLVPQYDWMQEQASLLLPFQAQQAFTIVDLGAGSGRLTARILRLFPRATAILVDKSTEMRNIAEEYLAEFSSRLRYVVSDLLGPWEQSICEPVHAAVSMAAIHHLNREEKQALFLRIHARLDEGGMLVNVDEVRAAVAAEHIANIRFWRRHAACAAASMPASVCEEYFQRYFAPASDGSRVPATSGARRAIANARGMLFHRRLNTVDSQLEMMRQAGFQCVRAPLTYYMWAIMSGRKSSHHPTANASDCEHTEDGDG